MANELAALFVSVGLDMAPLLRGLSEAPRLAQAQLAAGMEQATRAATASVSQAASQQTAAVTAGARAQAEAVRQQVADQNRQWRDETAFIKAQLSEQEAARRAGVSAADRQHRDETAFLKQQIAEQEAARRKQVADEERQWRDESLFIKQQLAERRDAERAAANVSRAAARGGGAPTYRDRAASVGTGATLAGQSLLQNVTRPLVQGFTEGLHAAADFEQELNVFQATTGASADQMRRARQEAVALGNDLTLPNTSAKDALDTMEQQVRMGVPFEQMLKATRGEILLSAAAQIQNADAARYTTDIIRQFNLDYGRSGEVADKLTNAWLATGRSVNMLGDAMLYAGPAAHRFKVGLNDALAEVALLSQHGLSGEMGGTNLRAFWQRIYSPTPAGANALKAMNVNPYDAQGAPVGQVDLLSQLKKGFGGLTPQVQNEAFKALFGQQASGGAATLITEGPAALAKMEAQIARQGRAAQIAKAQMDGLNGAIDAFKSALDTAALQETPFLAPLKDIVLWGGNLVNRLSALPPATQKFAGGLALAAAAAGPLLIGLGAIATGVAAVGAPVLIAAAAITALGVALATNVGGIRTTVVAALGPVKDFILTQFATVKAWFDKNLPEIREAVGTVLAAIAQFWREHGARIMAVVRPLWDFIKVTVGAALKIVLDIISVGLDVINGHWDKAGAHLKNIAANLWDVVKALFRDGLKAVGNTLALLPELTLDVGKRVLTAALGLGKSLVDGLLNGLKTAVSSAGKAVEGAAQAVINAAKKALGIKSPSTVFHEIGEQTVAGFVEGVDANRGKATSSAVDLVKNARMAALFEVKKHLTDAEKEQKRHHDSVLSEEARFQKEMAVLRGQITDARATGRVPASFTPKGPAQIGAQFPDVPGAQVKQMADEQAALAGLVRGHQAAAKAKREHESESKQLEAQEHRLSDETLKARQAVLAAGQGTEKYNADLIAGKTAVEIFHKPLQSLNAEHRTQIQLLSQLKVKEAMTEPLNRAKVALDAAGISQDKFNLSAERSRVALEMFNKPLADVTAGEWDEAAAVAALNVQTANGAAARDLQAQNAATMLTIQTQLHPAVQAVTLAQRDQNTALTQYNARLDELTPDLQAAIDKSNLLKMADDALAQGDRDMAQALADYANGMANATERATALAAANGTLGSSTESLRREMEQTFGGDMAPNPYADVAKNLNLGGAPGGGSPTLGGPPIAGASFSLPAPGTKFDNGFVMPDVTAEQKIISQRDSFSPNQYLSDWGSYLSQVERQVSEAQNWKPGMVGAGMGSTLGAGALWDSPALHPTAPAGAAAPPHAAAGAMGGAGVMGGAGGPTNQTLNFTFNANGPINGVNDLNSAAQGMGDMAARSLSSV